MIGVGLKNQERQAREHQRGVQNVGTDRAGSSPRKAQNLKKLSVKGVTLNDVLNPPQEHGDLHPAVQRTLPYQKKLRRSNLLFVEIYDRSILV